MGLGWRVLGVGLVAPVNTRMGNGTRNKSDIRTDNNNGKSLGQRPSTSTAGAFQPRNQGSQILQSLQGPDCSLETPTYSLQNPNPSLPPPNNLSTKPLTDSKTKKNACCRRDLNSLYPQTLSNQKVKKTRHLAGTAGCGSVQGPRELNGSLGYVIIYVILYSSILCCPGLMLCYTILD